MAVICPECENPILITDEVEEGDTIQCDECGADLEVVSMEPVEVALVDDSGYVEEEDVRHNDEDDD